MLVFFFFLFIYGTTNQPKNENSEIKVYVLFIVNYKDGFSNRYGVNVNVPPGTKFKDFPKILNEKSMGEHYSVPFFKENGEIYPDVKVIFNNKVLEDNEMETILQPTSSVRFIFNLNEKSPYHKKEL
ncbi:hypothetical protein M9Y10_014551 [Tritrichomonas musculus]|uniref:Uncharacterized protein n=1 Tax=Tritrichomonas musculus TaxID=1915356 RepID=A0ABR2KZU6_9EUKA